VGSEGQLLPVVVLGDVLAEHPSLGIVVRIAAETGLRHWVREGDGTTAYEHVRDALVLQVLVDGGVGEVAETTDNREDFVLLDELSHHLHCIGRVVVVIPNDEPYLAAVDASLRVDVVEVGAHGVGDGRVGRGGCLAEREVGPQQDLRIRDARDFLGDRRLGARQLGRCRRPTSLLLPTTAQQKETGEEEHGCEKEPASESCWHYHAPLPAPLRDLSPRSTQDPA
jgi:hypothetical protein